jgi:hypothetical protein
MLRVAVCGEGPIALSIAAVCGWRGHLVRVLADAPFRWRNWLVGCLPERGGFGGPLELITTEARRAVERADVVFVCVRHYQTEEMLRKIAPYLGPESLVGAIPGFGGFAFVARRIIPTVTCLFGTQRIPFVVGGHVPGRSVFISGIRRQTFVATMPASRAPVVAELLNQLLGETTVPVSHFVNIELSPSNSLVNPARLYSLFGPKARNPPRIEQEFFLDWDIRSSRMLLALDGELQRGRFLIPRDTSFVAPILLQYDSNDAATLTKRFRGLRPLAHRPIPLRRHAGGHVLDAESDYVREDIDFGLAVIRDILNLAGASTPLMDEIVEWRGRLVPAFRAGIRVAGHPPSRSFRTIQELMSALD